MQQAPQTAQSRWAFSRTGIGISRLLLAYRTWNNTLVVGEDASSEFKNGTIFQYRLHKHEKENTPALDFA
jgi:hypothetical protein